MSHTDTYQQEIIQSFNLFLSRLNYLGIDYKNSPLEIREQLSFSKELIANNTALFAAEIGPTIILNTCNRLEFYISSDHSPLELKRRIFSLISRIKNIPKDKVSEHMNYAYGIGVIQHLFQVSAGLESMIVGEGQILNQVKNTYKESTIKDTVLNQLFQRAISVGKKVRSETKIAQGAVSIPHAALQIAQREYNLNNSQILILGTGEIAKVTVNLLANLNLIPNITLVQRNSNEIKDKYPEIKTESYTNLYELVKSNQIIFVCTSASDYILGETHLTNNDSKLIFDMSLPRNVNPIVRNINKIELIDLDNLKDKVNQNLQSRSNEINAAESLISSEIERFKNWFNHKQLMEYDLI